MLRQLRLPLLPWQRGNRGYPARHEHPDVAKNLNNLALLLIDTGRRDEAVPLMRRQLEILVSFAAATGHPHPSFLLATINYGTLLKEIGNTEEEVKEKVSKVLEPISRK